MSESELLQEMDVLTLAELRKLMTIAGVEKRAHAYPDKAYGWIVLILRNGFVFVGDTRREGGVGYLKGYQVRRWTTRAGALPEFASKGRVKEDLLDKIDGEFEFPWSDQNVIGVLPCGSNWSK